MNRLNPTAVIFWIACASFGYVFGGAQGAALGAGIALSLSVVVDMLQ